MNPIVTTLASDAMKEIFKPATAALGDLTKITVNEAKKVASPDYVLQDLGCLESYPFMVGKMAGYKNLPFSCNFEKENEKAKVIRGWLDGESQRKAEERKIELATIIKVGFGFFIGAILLKLAFSINLNPKDDNK